MSTHEERLAFIRTYLDSFIQLSEMNGNPPGLRHTRVQAEYVIENGEAFQGRRKPGDYAWDEIKLCFQNAAQLAMADGGLTYYEGWAVGKVSIPIHHAWCIDEDGAVVDTTWRELDEDPTGWSYFGVGFQTDFVCRVVLDKETWGVLDSPLVYEEDDDDDARSTG